MKKFLSTIGVKQPGEKQVRQVQQTSLCGSIKVEYKTLSFDNTDTNTTEFRSTPVAYIENLSTFVTDLLEKYKKAQLLTWHQGIPEDEIWVKIGGDHGGGSMKLMLQIGNVVKPNSKNNTFLISISNAKDTHANLKKIIEPFKAEVENLKKLTWENKRIRLFFFGDYDFMLKTFGLSSAASKHPCLYCKATNTQFQTPQSKRPHSEKRTYKNIEKDNRAYVKAGGQIKNAKAYNNAIHKPLLKIDQDFMQVTPPYLHLLLGIVKKHHTLLEQQCNDLDKKIAEKIVEEKKDTSTENFTPAFKKYLEK